nr:putative disease resistance protein [Quercus suber]
MDSNEDLLDEIATDASRYKLEAELKSKVQLFNLTSHSSSYKEIELKIEETIGRLKYLAKQRDLLGLKEANFVSGEFCFRMEADNSYGLSGKTRYFSYSRMNFDAYEKFEAFHGAKGLRSFLPSNVSVRKGCLRTKLRYLEISQTAIKVLPDSVCTLYNLQTMLLSRCRSLTELPANMGWLINLRHLDISGTNLIKMPLLMDRLKSLQTLTSFILGKKGGSSIKELREFQQLKGSLSILKLENVVDARDALEANLREKLQLNELVLKWGGDTNDSKKDRDVLDQLKPHAKLRKLTIENYGGTIFSDWLGQAYCNIVSVQIHNCKYCQFLPPFGKLPSLKNLSIVGLDGVVNIGTEFYGTDDSKRKTFESLKNLRIKNMMQLQEWLPFRDENEGAAWPDAHPAPISSDFDDLNISNFFSGEAALVLCLCSPILISSTRSAVGILLKALLNGWPSGCTKDVLEKLVPHTNLNKLQIHNYGGTRFQGFDELVAVGPEFYGNNSLAAQRFLSLEILV